jgi:hypothetical protein
MTPEKHDNPVNIQITLWVPQSKSSAMLYTSNSTLRKLCFFLREKPWFIMLLKMLHYSRLVWYIVPLHSFRLCKFPIISYPSLGMAVWGNLRCNLHIYWEKKVLEQPWQNTNILGHNWNPKFKKQWYISIHFYFSHKDWNLRKWNLFHISKLINHHFHYNCNIAVTCHENMNRA